MLLAERLVRVLWATSACGAQGHTPLHACATRMAAHHHHHHHTYMLSLLRRTRHLHVIVSPPPPLRREEVIAPHLLLLCVCFVAEPLGLGVRLGGRGRCVGVRVCVGGGLGWGGGAEVVVAIRARVARERSG